MGRHKVEGKGFVSNLIQLNSLKRGLFKLQIPQNVVQLMANITNNNYTFKQSSPNITWEMDSSYKSKDCCELLI